MLNFFNHPSKRSATIISILVVLGWLSILLVDTRYFREGFDPDPLTGIGLVIGFWLLVRVWLNYGRVNREEGQG
ncbi:hypothetical protein CEQ90_11915 [Lewinellaceae bacterium SD302]|nr:hypothetical protein CEQ90_11915 [Lewinellaceae bacterium SD302]